MSGIDKLCNRCENCAFREGKVAVTTDTQTRTTRTDRQTDTLHADEGGGRRDDRTGAGGERMNRVYLFSTKSDSYMN